ncbi:MAG: sugar phosphate isomerase/epimerase [Clostridiales bacterium]|nr:sugar phosphate isomerase/epimerase [Clostridiales bacterium]
MIKTSIFFEHLYDIAAQTGCTPAQAMKEAKKLGIDYVEADAFRAMESIDELKRLLNSAELKVGGMFGFFDFAHEKQPEKVNELLDCAQALNAANIMPIPGFINEGEDRAAAIDSMVRELNILCDKAQKRGITVTLEDFDSVRAPYGTAEELAYFLERVPGLYCTFDTGNFIVRGDDVLRAFDLLKNRIAHVHMKDRAFAPVCGEEPLICEDGKKLYPAPVGSGDLPMTEIANRLCEHGYNGICAIEHFGAKDQQLFMHRSARWLKIAI